VDEAGTRWLGISPGALDRAVPLAVGLVVFGLSVWATAPPPLFGKTSHGPVVLPALACAVTATLARRWLSPLLVAAAAGWLFYGLWPALVASSYYAATTQRRRSHQGAYAAAAAAAVLIPGAVAAVLYASDVDNHLLETAATAALLVGLPLVAGLWVTARRQLLAGLRERAHRLEAEQAARTDQARAEERARIAREMHDVLAHQVSLIVLHAGALEVNAPNEHTAATAALIRTTGRQALTDLRQVLGMLRTTEATLTPQPTLADLDTLLEQSRAAGIPVHRHDEGEPRPLPPTVQRAAYRTVQEALTNVHKHAGDAATDVTIHYQPDDLQITVANTAPTQPTNHSVPGSGLGLAGLRERIELLGGHLHARQRLDGGFTVHARLPANHTAGAA
jgi:signal transduction histidine kinase